MIVQHAHNKYTAKWWSLYHYAICHLYKAKAPYLLWIWSVYWYEQCRWFVESEPCLSCKVVYVHIHCQYLISRIVKKKYCGLNKKFFFNFIVDHRTVELLDGQQEAKKNTERMGDSYSQYIGWRVISFGWMGQLPCIWVLGRTLYLGIFSIGKYWLKNYMNWFSRYGRFHHINQSTDINISFCLILNNQSSLTNGFRWFVDNHIF